MLDFGYVQIHINNNVYYGKVEYHEERGADIETTVGWNDAGIFKPGLKIRYIKIDSRDLEEELL